MSKNFVQPGMVMQITASAPIASGEVVKVGNTLGVALVNLAAGESGSVQVCGVFTVPKVENSVIAQGEALVFKAASKSFAAGDADTAAGDVTGGSAVAFEGAGAGQTSVAVKFTGVPGTVA